MRIGLVIPNPVGVRDFLLGRFLDHLAQSYDVVVFHKYNETDLREIGVCTGPTIEYIGLADHSSSGLMQVAQVFLYNTLRFAHMRWAATRSMQHNLKNAIKGGLKRRLSLRLARMFSWFLAFSWGIQLLARLHDWACARLPSVKQYRVDLNLLDVDKLISSTQRFQENSFLAHAARLNGIEVASFVSSWDNLTTKARIWPRYDRYFVWSDWMAEELRHFHPDVHKSEIIVVGAPQFAHLADKRNRPSDRKAFLEQLGFESDKKIICYSGAMMGISDEDVRLAELLAEQVGKGDVDDCWIVVRPSPYETSDRYAALASRYKQMKVFQPEWKVGMGGDLVPSKEDIAFLANLTFHSDLNVNIASTMTIDFAIRNKPVVNIAFGFDAEHTSLYRDYYQFDHYRHVIRFKAVRVANTPEELASLCNDYLRNPDLDSSQRQDLVDYIAGLKPDVIHDAVMEGVRAFVEF